MEAGGGAADTAVPGEDPAYLGNHLSVCIVSPSIMVFSSDLEIWAHMVSKLQNYIANIQL